MKSIDRIGARIGAAALAFLGGVSLMPAGEALGQSTVQGDVNGDGVVGFEDLVLVLANWQGTAPQNLGWGVVAPYVRAVHQSQVASIEETACILVLSLDADFVVDLLGQPEKRRGMRSLMRPAGWPAWPPPGSALEALMERTTYDAQSVERLARQMLAALPPLPFPPEPPAELPPAHEPPGTPEPPEIPENPDHGAHPQLPEPPPETPEPTGEPHEEPTPGANPDDL